MRYLAFLIIVGLAVLAWCPWFKAEEAQSLVEAEATQLRSTVPNLCPIEIHPDSIKRVPFGYSEEVYYDCAVNDFMLGVERSYNSVIITFYKDVIGMPRKTLLKYPN